MDILPNLTGWTFLAPYNSSKDFFYSITFGFAGELTKEMAPLFYTAFTYKFEDYGVLKKLSSESLVSLFNCLKDYSGETLEESPTLNITSVNIAKLTNDELAIATNKGWALV